MRTLLFVLTLPYEVLRARRERREYRALVG